MFEKFLYGSLCSFNKIAVYPLLAPPEYLLVITAILPFLYISRGLPPEDNVMFEYEDIDAVLFEPISIWAI